MRLSETGEEAERFLRVPGKFQSTFLTPPTELPRFVATILSPFRLDHANITIKQAVFEPQHLLRLLASHSIAAENCENLMVTAFGHNEIVALLEAAFGDWVDFLFTPAPRRFAIYADHDEYTTFLADSQSDLKLITAALEHGGFAGVPEYKREF